MQLATCNHGRRGYGINKGFSRKIGGCKVGGEKLFKVLMAWRDFYLAYNLSWQRVRIVAKGLLVVGNIFT